jgi:hypothetical protein
LLLFGFRLPSSCRVKVFLSLRRPRLYYSPFVSSLPSFVVSWFLSPRHSSSSFPPHRPPHHQQLLREPQVVADSLLISATLSLIPPIISSPSTHLEPVVPAVLLSLECIRRIS